MAKKKVKVTEKVAKPIPKSVHGASINRTDDLPFGKGNFMYMFIGIGLILLGFVIMTQDKEPFGFGFLGITLGPIIVFLGFMVEIYAILKKKG